MVFIKMKNKEIEDFEIVFYYFSLMLIGLLGLLFAITLRGYI